MPTVIRQGDTVAFQTYRRDHWIGCWSNRCAPANCPRVFFAGNDWNGCRGEIFQIYKPRPGEIRVGDIVGVHYPHEKGRWLGCSHSECGKYNCPGNPTHQNGFADQNRWFRCFGEVFRIYAYGKNINARITSGDLIMLYYVNNGNWVNGAGTLKKATCPGTAPPASNKYDVCSHEGFKIVKRR